MKNSQNKNKVKDSWTREEEEEEKAQGTERHRYNAGTILQGTKKRLS